MIFVAVSDKMGEGKRKKVLDYARFTRKTYAQLAETVQTRSFVAQTGQFQAPTSLVFRFTGRGRSSANRELSDRF